MIMRWLHEGSFENKGLTVKGEERLQAYVTGHDTPMTWVTFTWMMGL